MRTTGHYERNGGAEIEDESDKSEDQGWVEAVFEFFLLRRCWVVIMVVIVWIEKSFIFSG